MVVLFGSIAMAFTSPEDLMNNVPKAVESISGMFGGKGTIDSPTMKMSIRKYHDMGIKVGYKVTIDPKIW